MFEIMIQNLESVHLIVKHHLGCATPDLDGKIGSAVPGVDLAHTGKKEAGMGVRIAGMFLEWFTRGTGWA